MEGRCALAKSRGAKETGAKGAKGAMGAMGARGARSARGARGARSARSARGATGAGVPRALAIAAHPDDIEFMMAGTLLLLHDAGWEIHCMNISSGNLGSLTMSPAKIARIRRAEAQASAAVMQAVWHAPICNDLQVFYDCLLYTSPSPRDGLLSRMPSSA